MDAHLHMGELKGNGERGGGESKKTEWRHLLAELDKNHDVAYYTFWKRVSSNPWRPGYYTFSEKDQFYDIDA